MNCRSQIAAFLGVSLCCTVQATTLVDRPLEQDINQANLIALVETLSVKPEAFVNEATGEITGIKTHVTFAVHDIYKGKATSEITLTFDGGRIRKYFRETAGMPRFKAGDMSVLLIDTTLNGQCPVVGWWKGNFQLTGPDEDPEIINEEIAKFRHKAATLLADASIMEMGGREAPSKLSLGRFENILRRVITKSREKQKEGEIGKYLTPEQIKLLQKKGGDR